MSIGRVAKLSNVSDFCHDFDNYLEGLMHLPGKLIIAGDFNIHPADEPKIKVDCPSTPGIFQNVVGPFESYKNPMNIRT